MTNHCGPPLRYKCYRVEHKFSDVVYSAEENEIRRRICHNLKENLNELKLNRKVIMPKAFQSTGVPFSAQLNKLGRLMRLKFSFESN